MRQRLCNATLAALPASVARPTYDRTAIEPGIVHLGIGAFHRAHQAVYLDDLLAQGDPRWGVIGASLRAPETRDALRPQDHLYSLAIPGADETQRRVIGSVIGTLVAPEDPSALISAMADPRTKIVSLTVTEKGYCLDPATGLLDETHPDIRHDLASPDRPRSAPGFLLAGLRRRRQAGLPPFTILPCDNLASNGKKLHALLLRLAEASAPDLLSFIREELACPSTMVDRIVPKTTDADRADADEALGVVDAWPVVTEPFTQFVIEDRFSLSRPDWASVGAELVDDVAPYEAMKLRLLNASHTMLALAGSIAGYRTVAEVMADPDLHRFIKAFMIEDVLPVLAVPQGADGQAYAERLVARFCNPGLRHRLDQIASDTSQKIPPRLLSTGRERLARGLPLGRIAVGLAALIPYALGRDEAGEPLHFNDPIASDLRADLIAASGPPEARVRTLLAHRAIFGDLGENPVFAEALTSSLRTIEAQGIRTALQNAAR